MIRQKLVVIGLLGRPSTAAAGRTLEQLAADGRSLPPRGPASSTGSSCCTAAASAPLAEVVDRRHRAPVSPETTVRPHVVDFGDPWDFEQVYGALHDFAADYPFDPEREDYLVHVTTGTHVAQICLFLLTESRYLPARLLQTAPPQRHRRPQPGSFAIIDLDLSKYDRLAARFEQQQREDLSFLKAGIDTRSRRLQPADRADRAGGDRRRRAPLLLTRPDRRRQVPARAAHLRAEEDPAAA